MRHLLAIFRLVRLPNTFTAAADVLAGAAIAGVDPLRGDVLACAVGSGLLYGGGIALNDRLDLEKDRVAAPDRVLPRGDLAARTASWLALVLLAGGAATAAVGGMSHVVSTGALVVAIVIYDIIPARRKLAGSVVMGACRGLNLMRGMTLAVVPVAVFPHGVTAAAHVGLICLVTVVSTFEGSGRRGVGWKVALLLMPLPYLVPALLGPWWVLVAGVALSGWVTAPGWTGGGQPVAVVKRAIFTLVIFDALYAAATEYWLTAAILVAFLPLIHLLAKAIGQRGS